MQHLNSQEEVTLQSNFYACAIQVLELHNGEGAHHCQHAGPDEHTTENVSFCPMILSKSHLHDKTIKKLEKEGKPQGVDFKTL